MQSASVNRLWTGSKSFLCYCRLVPRRGAGPGLRSGGREIDEYLMRLLHAGSSNASEAALYRQEVRRRQQAGYTVRQGFRCCEGLILKVQRAHSKGQRHCSVAQSAV